MVMKEKFDLNGKVAIVTGGSRGIGLAIAHGLKEFGAEVVVTDIVNHRIKETEGLSFIKCDNRKPHDIIQMVQNVTEKFKRIDILVNNAGIVLKKPAVETEIEDWEEVFRVNVTGTFLVSREVGKVMLRQKKGRIINIGSNYGSIGNVDFSAYCSSKAAVIHMSRVLGLEWAKKGIRVNAVSPAATRTEMTRLRLADPKIRSHYEYNFPVGRVLEPEDLVGAVIYLASDASEMVTGHNLNVDGGYLSQ
jgi:NAD(P)-dependent dehydrogenase (short-subunit alcohol dehydrogenase family)